MPHAKRTTGDGLSKFQRYRRTQRNKGMKLLRVWVPDTHRPEFAKEAERQARLLRGRPEEKEALDFINSAFLWPDT
ncbi:MAG: antitoxin MazE family protein [Nitrospirae bacterium]|nr:antitoxin MazE family protein [Nitrospirota bacterium]